ncbi:MAG TPA: DUF2851 family protein [Puia sp.]|jgi:hypothetical protein
MREDLLQFIWRYLYFNQSHLITEAGEALQILSPGELNTDAGPDFRNARIRLNNTLQEGPVELHIKASDWDRHGHEGDPNYRGVILHVVWENDGGPAGLPVLVLQHRVSKLLLGQYEKWMKSRLFVPCAAQLPQVGTTVWTRWKEDLVLQRLYHRARIIRDWLSANHQHWEETTWWLMARSMGQPVNPKPFEALAQSIPLPLLARYRSEPARLKALLLGQAGLLEPSLQREYRFFQAKHHLQPISTPILFHRMRPANAPHRRLAQLAELFSSGESWFAQLRDAGSSRELKLALKADGLGPDMKKGLLINAFVPVLFAYGLLRKEPACREKALAWLAAEKPEKNTRISNWQRLGVEVRTAADSQSLLELKKTYCDDRRCLDCAIGQALLRSSN